MAEVIKMEQEFFISYVRSPGLYLINYLFSPEVFKIGIAGGENKA